MTTNQKIRVEEIRKKLAATSRHFDYDGVFVFGKSIVTPDDDLTDEDAKFIDCVDDDVEFLLAVIDDLSSGGD